MSVFDKISEIKAINGEYASVLFTALKIIGESELEKLLLEADKRGKKIRLTYPIPFSVGPSEPNGVELI